MVPKVESNPHELCISAAGNLVDFIDLVSPQQPDALYVVPATAEEEIVKSQGPDFVTLSLNCLTKRSLNRLSVGSLSGPIR
jgi:hypothetical protein